MSLSLKATKGRAVFGWAAGPMTANWVMSDDMTEDDLLEALLAMVKFVTVQPHDADVIPLRAVETTYVDSSYRRPPVDHQDEQPSRSMGWTAPKHIPTPSELAARLPSSFELITDED